MQALSTKISQLTDQITDLEKNPSCDSLEVRRLKAQRLNLEDRLARLELSEKIVA